MAVVRAKRLQAGSPLWISEERSCALHIVQSETEEFTYSVRNEVDWLNEHMAEIFSADRVSVADIFKTPAKLRGKTPRTIRKSHLPLERPPLSNIFSTASAVCSSPKQLSFVDLPPSFRVAEDKTRRDDRNFPGTSYPVPASLPKLEERSTNSNLLDQSQQENLNPSTPGHVFGDSTTTQCIELIKSPQALDADSADIAKNRFPSDHSVIVNDSTGSPNRQSRQNSPVIEMQTTEKTQKNISEIANRSPVSHKRSSNSLGINPIPSPGTKSSTPFSKLHQQELRLSLATESIESNIDRSNSPSDGSSPILPMVRKSSLNFASLPAREPLTKKSLGNRLSRPSQLDQPRVSYFGLQTVGKSFDNITNKEEREMEDLSCNEAGYSDTDTTMIRLHSKTSTQRLQDQISKLGQTHKNMRPWNQNNCGITHAQLIRSSQKDKNMNLGNGNHQTTERESEILSESCLNVRISQSASSSEESENLCSNLGGVNLQTNSSDNKLCLEKIDGLQKSNLVISNHQSVDFEQPGKTSSNHDSESISANNSAHNNEECQNQFDIISASNPSSLITSKKSTTSLKSPTKAPRNSPLKAAKDKFSSILKNSKVLFANTIASNAEDKFATNSLSVTQDEFGDKETLGELPCNFHEVEAFPSVESISCEVSSDIPQSVEPLPEIIHNQSHILPSQTGVKKDPRKSKPSKEAKSPNKMDCQLENARIKVREEAHLYHIEQERFTSMKNEESTSNPCEKRVKVNRNDMPRVTRNSPRKTRPHLEVEKVNAGNTTNEFPSKNNEKSSLLIKMPAPTPSSKSQIGRPDNMRPLKPSREASKTKPPTVIKVDIGSQRGQQYHPSNTTLSATLQESLSSQSNAPPYRLRHKASTSSVQSKSSSSSFKSVATKTLEAAARKKEKDEIAAARKREVKIEIERQRAATKQEEKRKELLKKRKEAENQAHSQREGEMAAKISEIKKATSRQAIDKRRLEIEKTKESRTAPQTVRNEIASDPERARSILLKSSKTQQEPPRTIVGNINIGSMHPPKRLFQHDIDDQYVRPILQRNGTSHLHVEQHSKRRKTNESDKDFNTDYDRPKMTAPPIRQSSIRQKEISTKSIFTNNYANSVSSSNLQRSTLISQHNLNQPKTTHPMDMAQLSKGPIPFAPISNQESSQYQSISSNTVASNLAMKTNVKSSANKVPRSSPRYQNGENIDLPEIKTDSENEDSEEDVGVRPEWTDTPEIQRQLEYQEYLDPALVFGQPGPLNMEEVFSKCKDRFPKFRARTSSANWSGTDKLTEDEIQRDIEGRDRVRRQGGWTYDAMV
ncbi:putative inner centromere protein [Golovinomyces cichoracearum]|uniref:Putative inner centromere protein n=1 Tax=Golovinomyces cichoracearum TaxID=62708 RepID=A0A420IJU2_9PEZI|nr:putative inner centromere protein [Golovinomyces cichoracearum]